MTSFLTQTKHYVSIEKDTLEQGRSRKKEALVIPRSQLALEVKQTIQNWNR